MAVYVHPPAYTEIVTMFQNIIFREGTRMKSIIELGTNAPVQLSNCYQTLAFLMGIKV